jgi:hypothetical protein
MVSRAEGTRGDDRRQVASLRQQVRELEVRAERYLDRIRELEAFVAITRRPAGLTVRDSPDSPDLTAGRTTGSQASARFQAMDQRRLPGQLQVATINLEEKELEIARLARAADERLRLAEQFQETVRARGDVIAAQRAAIVQLQTAADERLRLIEQLSIVADERQRVIEELTIVAEERLRLIEQLSIMADEGEATGRIEHGG